MGDIRWKKCNESDLFAWKSVAASVFCYEKGYIP